MDPVGIPGIRRIQRLAGTGHRPYLESTGSGRLPRFLRSARSPPPAEEGTNGARLTEGSEAHGVVALARESTGAEDEAALVVSVGAVIGQILGGDTRFSLRAPESQYAWRIPSC